ncbi:ubiquitin carboxyl-terminal hydrolase 47 isoform X2 [Microcaecilia unicolor]|uniref:Ubiquitin carboxyl-terminal hydrolase 47-like isoform X2 n=1 Tax=Microcaecilia unicolor TaxID=1415580 RepID=A0A6P7YYX4_9AMPH|nr:ubiquitin carboxyl-terminal hydrolase 47-like isoform X2 [Microcaecilia unicolor]
MRGWGRMWIFGSCAVLALLCLYQCYRKRKQRKILDAKLRNSPRNRSAYLGLRNQGSTCYLNSLLQCLFLAPNFTNILFNYRIWGQPGIVYQLQKLFINLQYGRTAPSTQEITDSLGINNVHQPQDVEKYFRHLVNKIGEESGEILQLFVLDMVHCIRCERCDKKTILPNCMLSLPLSIQQPHSSLTDAFSVKDALDNFLKQKELTGENKCYCDLCESKQDASSLFYFKYLPKILVIILKRYEFYNTSFRKLHDKVSVPCELTVPQSSSTEENAIQCMYNLFAICHHHGGVRGGHYVAEINSFEDNHWYHFNDAAVCKIIEEENLLDTKISDTAYLLMYHQQNAHIPSFLEKNQLNSYMQNLIDETLRRCENHIFLV